MKISSLAGNVAPVNLLVNVSKLVTAYYTGKPNPAITEQRIKFGTSGHRGSSFKLSFNEAHVLAISQAICNFRKRQQIDGPLFIGIDTHALSEPAFSSALEVLAANGVEVMMAANEEYTPTPAISHAILCYNRGRSCGLADGIVITPSHNPPEYGGFKYNPPHGGPAETCITQWIEQQANILLAENFSTIRRLSFKNALQAPTTHHYDFLNSYVSDLDSVIDMDAIRSAHIRIGVDPLGGAGVHYWPAIAEQYKLDLTVINKAVDATFRFMTLDWDGQIRMDPSSQYAMQSLIDVKGRFDIAFACDTDHDRHGIVTRDEGLMPANHFLAVAIDYLFQHRPAWSVDAAIGKTLVSTQMIDRVCAKLGRSLVETPVGFKWFSSRLHNGSLGFAGEESAGATFMRQDGTVWTTDKDGFVSALLAAEITARTGQGPANYYHNLTLELGEPFTRRLQATATSLQKCKLSKLSSQDITTTMLAGEKIASIMTHTLHDDEAIGGIKVITKNAWFAARPSGTENIYKIYAESFYSDKHLQQVLAEAQIIVDKALSLPE